MYILVGQLVYLKYRKEVELNEYRLYDKSKYYDSHYEQDLYESRLELTQQSTQIVAEVNEIKVIEQIMIEWMKKEEEEGNDEMIVGKVNPIVQEKGEGGDVPIDNEIELMQKIMVKEIEKEEKEEIKKKILENFIHAKRIRALGRLKKSREQTKRMDEETKRMKEYRANRKIRRKRKKEYKIKKLVEEGIVKFQNDEEELRILKCYQNDTHPNLD